MNDLCRFSHREKGHGGRVVRALDLESRDLTPL